MSASSRTTGVVTATIEPGSLAPTSRYGRPPASRLTTSTAQSAATKPPANHQYVVRFATRPVRCWLGSAGGSDPAGSAAPDIAWFRRPGGGLREYPLFVPRCAVTHAHHG